MLSAQLDLRFTRLMDLAVSLFVSTSSDGTARPLWPPLLRTR